MIIGIPKEIMQYENRVALIPELVGKLVKEGHKVLIETGAGEGSFHSDDSYRAKGCEIVEKASELYGNSEIIIKVKEPRFNEKIGLDETQMMKEGTLLIAFLHPAAPHNLKMINALKEKKVTSFTLDSIPRTSDAQKMDALTSMSMVSGYKSFLLAAEQLPRFVPNIKTPMGELHGAKCLVVGVGVVGIQALKTAKGLGADIMAIDIREEAKEEAQRLGAQVVGIDFPDEISGQRGNVAKHLPADRLEQERNLIREIIKEVDIVILSTLVFGQRAPILITKDMLPNMRKGAVISDVAVDQGGNCEATVPGKIVLRDGVKIIGILNIPGTMPEHATWLYANNAYQFILHLIKSGGSHFDPGDDILKTSIVTHQGKILHSGVKE